MASATVCKHGDSRVPITQGALDRLVARAADPDAARLATLRHAMVDRKGIHPNLDYPADLAYQPIPTDGLRHPGRHAVLRD